MQAGPLNWRSSGTQGVPCSWLRLSKATASRRRPLLKCVRAARRRMSIYLLHQVILRSQLFDLVKLGLDPVDVAFLFP